MLRVPTLTVCAQSTATVAFPLEPVARPCDALGMDKHTANRLMKTAAAKRTAAATEPTEFGRRILVREAELLEAQVRAARGE